MSYEAEIERKDGMFESKTHVRAYSENTILLSFFPYAAQQIFVCIFYKTSWLLATSKTVHCWVLENIILDKEHVDRNELVCAIYLGQWTFG